LPLEPIALGPRLHDQKRSHGALLDDLSVDPTMRDYRIGHAKPGTRGVYSRPTPKIRIDLVTGLQRAHDQYNRSDYGLSAARPQREYATTPAPTSTNAPDKHSR
jgi:hypothetical protein